MTIEIRIAHSDDLASILPLFWDDKPELKQACDGQITDDMYRIFDHFATSKDHFLYVATIDDNVVGTLQLSFIPQFTYNGEIRANIEGVFVANHAQGKGVGASLVEFAIEQSRYQGCKIVQLVSNQVRERVHQFYERLGFEKSHYGFKYYME
ncbi:GNAT family N-acetyltransferase [Vibrio mediterranei]|uniref:GNAT family N-acetyltransferase n=1 Tax=Vibrio mediterranei TaxID=689 RepID=UPI0018320602|nr:GNAT family N-acetyltransferase [Vibrio mediterranei]NUW74530.1 GNAT family N-acetyltransferase [Vibrio mediterranei]